MSDKKCVREKYLYLSAYLRAREAKMLTAEAADRLLGAADFDDAAKQLCDFGYEDMSGMGPDGISGALNRRRQAELAGLTRLVPDKEITDIFRIRYDYHNAKVLIKAEAMGGERPELLSEAGRVAPDKLTAAFHDDCFTFCPSVLGKAISDAKRILNRSENPQLADLTLDKAYFAELEALSSKLGSKFVKSYVELLIDCTNLKTAVRCMRMKKSPEFLKSALIEGGSVRPDRICSAGSAEAIPGLFAVTKLKAAAVSGADAVSGGRLTAFELACDNAVTEFLRDAKLVSYGEAPVVAYLAAMETELTAVRMILTGLKTGIAPETIRERLRDMYA